MSGLTAFAELALASTSRRWNWRVDTPGGMETLEAEMRIAFSVAVPIVLAADTMLVTLPVKGWLIGRGKGHAVMHQLHH